MNHYYETVPGGAWFLNAYGRILDALPKLTPSTWVEVGVFHGQSLSWLGVEVINRGLPVSLVAVDSFAGWPGVAQGEELRSSFERHMAPIRAELNGRFRVVPLPSVEAAKQFADDSLDVVWIDADHSYEAVKADLAAWWPKVKPGGILGGDDWCMTGVAWAVHEKFGLDYTLIPGFRKDVSFEGPWPSWVVRR